MTRISKGLTKPIVVYHIGGNAMCLSMLKESTKDIDIVVSSNDDAMALICAIKKALKTRSKEVLDDTNYHYEIEAGQGVIEVFCGHILDKFTLSESIIERCIEYGRLGDLTQKLFSKEDIFLFKAVTDRRRDLEDLRVLFESGIVHEIILQEWRNQLLQHPRPFLFYSFRRSIKELENIGYSMPGSRKFILDVFASFAKTRLKYTTKNIFHELKNMGYTPSEVKEAMEKFNSQKT